MVGSAVGVFVGCMIPCGVGWVMVGGVFARVCLMWRRGIVRSVCGAVGVDVVKVGTGESGCFSLVELAPFEGCHGRPKSSAAVPGREL